MTVNQLSASLLPAIMELAQDTKWRVRLQIIEHLPTLAAQLGAEFFDSKLSDLCMNWLGDQIYSIREAATGNLTKLVSVFGVNWAKSNIIPKVVTLGSHESYLFRMTAISAINDMSPMIGATIIQEQFLPVLIRLCSDSVPNVRFNCVRAIQQIVEKGLLGKDREKEKAMQQLVPVVNRLTQDTDTDVKYYATLCSQALQSNNG